MANSTSKGIVYPTSGDAIAPLETVFATMASSTDEVLIDIDSRTPKTFATIIERNLSSPNVGSLAFVQETGLPYYFNGMGWVKYFPDTFDASVVTSGEFLPDRIPNLDAAKITTGTIPDARIDGISASKITGQISGSSINGGYANVFELTASGAVNADSIVTDTSTVYESFHSIGNFADKIINPGGYTYLTNSTRKPVYITSGGRLGVSSSSIKTKQQIRPLDIDPEILLQVEPKSYVYNVDFDEFGDKAKRSAGFIAEELAMLGLEPFFSRGADGAPESITYSDFVVALQAIARYHNDRIIMLEARLAKLEGENNG